MKSLPHPPLHGVNYRIFIWEGGKKIHAGLKQHTKQAGVWYLPGVYWLLVIFFKVSQPAVVFG